MERLARFEERSKVCRLEARVWHPNWGRKFHVGVPLLYADTSSLPGTLVQQGGVRDRRHIRRLLRTEVRCNIKHKPPGFTQSGG